MPCAGEGEFAGFAVLRDGAACGGGCAAADVHGGNQRVVGADEYVVADGGLVLVCADVGQVVGFAACAQRAVFDFYEVADVYAVGECGVGAQAGEGADLGVCADGAAVEVAERSNGCACADEGVADDAVCADFYVVAQYAVAFKQAVCVYFYVLSDFQAAP